MTNRIIHIYVSETEVGDILSVCNSDYKWTNSSRNGGEERNVAREWGLDGGLSLIVDRNGNKYTIFQRLPLIYAKINSSKNRKDIGSIVAGTSP